MVPNRTAFAALILVTAVSRAGPSRRQQQVQAAKFTERVIPPKKHLIGRRT
jgi:hypothetical protein